MTRLAPQWLQNPSYSAAQDRMLIGALWPTPASTGLAVTPGGGMALNIAAGQVAIPTANNTGTTLCTADASEQVTIDPAPVSGTNRIDLVCAVARGADLDGGANDDWIYQVIDGIVAAAPVAPAVPAGAVALAQVYVGGGVAAIVAGNITDRRPGRLSMGNVGLGRIYNAVRTAANVVIATNSETMIVTLGQQVYRANRLYEIRAEITSVTTVANVRNCMNRIFNVQDGLRTVLWDGGNSTISTNHRRGGTMKFAPGAADRVVEFQVTAQNPAQSGNLTLVGGGTPDAATIAAYDVGSAV